MFSAKICVQTIHSLFHNKKKTKNKDTLNLNRLKKTYGVSRMCFIFCFRMMKHLPSRQFRLIHSWIMLPGDTDDYKIAVLLWCWNLKSS